MSNSLSNERQNKIIITFASVLSMFRICLIPIVAWLYI